jgi:hypothetical protein
MQGQFTFTTTDALVLLQDQKNIQFTMKLQAFLMTSGSGLWSYSHISMPTQAYFSRVSEAVTAINGQQPVPQSATSYHTSEREKELPQPII